MKSILFLSLISLSVFAGSTSPFTDVSFENSPSITVQANGENYYLLSINGESREDIMGKCNTIYSSECECMFAEKFSEMMEGIGLPISNTVKLNLYHFPTHTTLKLDDHSATLEKSESVINNRVDRNEACFYL